MTSRFKVVEIVCRDPFINRTSEWMGLSAAGRLFGERMMNCLDIYIVDDQGIAWAKHISGELNHAPAHITRSAGLITDYTIEIERYFGNSTTIDYLGKNGNLTTKPDEIAVYTSRSAVDAACDHWNYWNKVQHIDDRKATVRISIYEPKPKVDA